MTDAKKNGPKIVSSVKPSKPSPPAAQPFIDDEDGGDYLASLKEEKDRRRKKKRKISSTVQAQVKSAGKPNNKDRRKVFVVLYEEVSGAGDFAALSYADESDSNKNELRRREFMSQCPELKGCIDKSYVRPATKPERIVNDDDDSCQESDIDDTDEGWTIRHKVFTFTSQEAADEACRMADYVQNKVEDYDHSKASTVNSYQYIYERESQTEAAAKLFSPLSSSSSKK